MLPKSISLPEQKAFGNALQRMLADALRSALINSFDFVLYSPLCILFPENPYLSRLYPYTGISSKSQSLPIVITREIEARLKEYTEAYFKERDCVIQAMETMSDYIHS